MIKKAFFTQNPNFAQQLSFRGSELSGNGFRSFEDQFMVPYYSPGSYHDTYWTKKTFFKKLNKEQRKEKESSKSNVLHVEDCFIIRSMVKLQLRNGFELSQAESGEEALELMVKKSFDLILMDVNLGDGIDGIETASKIKEHPKWKDIPLVIVTTNDFSDIKERCMVAGVDAYLQKPYDKDDLLETIDVLM